MGLLLAITSCAQCVPEQVGQGVARLTARNVGAMLSLVNADATCGFASALVNDAVVITGELGGPGKVVYSVENCTIDGDKGGGPGLLVSTDCDGIATTVTGTVKVSATKEIVGTLTGDAVNPVVPAGPDAVTFNITNAETTNFKVTASGSKDILTQVSGTLSAVVQPRLAVSAANGACAVPTPNVTFSDISYGPSLVHVESTQATFDADVAASAFGAANGVTPAGENTISGTITVFGKEVDVAGDGNLDPAYDAPSFIEGYACTPDLTQPESFVCSDLDAKLADGAARLSIKMLGAIASAVDADTTCGFATPAVQQAPIINGAVGGPGSATFAITACTLSLPPSTTLAPDCNGVSTLIEGSITVTATKKLQGRLTGNLATPVVPTTDQPAVISLTSITVDGFKVSSSADENSLLARNGTLSGTVSPRVFVGSDTGVCSAVSPHASLTDVRWTAASLLVGTAQGSFAVNVDQASLTATNGVVGNQTNALGGSVTIGGNSFAIPSDGLGLDPAGFDQATFDSTWQCAEASPTLVVPVNEDCAGVIAAKLNGGVAALTMRSFGAVASAIDADTTCGFASPNAVASFDVLDVGRAGHAQISVLTQDCALDFGPAPGVEVASDCLGTTTRLQGAVVVAAGSSKVLRGWQTGDVTQPIVPSSFKPADLSLDLTFADFAVKTTDPEGAPGPFLTIADGTLTGTVTPRVALDPTTGACSIPTANAAFSAMSWTDAHARLSSDGNAFDFLVLTSALEAHAGTDGTRTNTLAGTMNVAGSDYTFSEGAKLDPAYVEADYDATYLCENPTTGITPILVSDAQCSFKDKLGNIAARLLVKASATSTVLLDISSCGFSSADPENPSEINGSINGLGNMIFTADDDCGTSLARMQLAQDCANTGTVAGGRFIAGTATKSVDGYLTGQNPPVLAVTRDATTFEVSDLEFDQWNVFDRTVAGYVQAAVTVTGTVESVVIEPIKARSLFDSGEASAMTNGAVTSVYSFLSGVIGIPNLEMASGSVSMILEGKTFIVDVTDVSIAAFVGTYYDTATATEVGSNDISGTITVDGERVVIPEGAALIEEYDQAATDALYSCRSDLGGDLVPSGP